MSSNDYKWYIENDLVEYSGKWVAIQNEKVLASEKDFKLLVKDITKKFKLSEIFLAHIPEKGISIVYVQC